MVLSVFLCTVVSNKDDLGRDRYTSQSTDMIVNNISCSDLAFDNFCANAILSGKKPHKGQLYHTAVES